MRHVHHCNAQRKNAVVQYGPLEQHLPVDRFQGIGEVKMAVSDWLRIQGPDFLLKEFLNWCQDARDASMCLGIIMNNNNTSTQYVSYM
jgi:hypothetical protein